MYYAIVFRDRIRQCIGYLYYVIVLRNVLCHRIVNVHYVIVFRIRIHHRIAYPYTSSYCVSISKFHTKPAFENMETRLNTQIYIVCACSFAVFYFLIDFCTVFFFLLGICSIFGLIK